jgi:VWFA-related protein
MPRGRQFRTALATAFAIAAALTAQPPSFRSESRMVQVPVTVTTASGSNIEGLKAPDFRLLDDGAPRSITLDTFGAGMAPISLVIAIQMSTVTAKTRRIGSMIQPLIIGLRGEVAVLTFDDEIAWRLNFTARPDAIAKAISALEPVTPQQKPPAAIFDAVLDAVDLMKDRPGRHALLLISQNKDRGSRASLARAVEAVERIGVQVFAVTSSSAGPDDPALVFAEATGGVTYPIGNIEKAIETLGVDIHSQYILSFRQDHSTPGRHNIELSTPDRPELRLRARRAYWSD